MSDTAVFIFFSCSERASFLFVFEPFQLHSMADVESFISFPWVNYFWCHADLSHGRVSVEYSRNSVHGAGYLRGIILSNRIGIRASVYGQVLYCKMMAVGRPRPRMLGKYRCLCYVSWSRASPSSAVIECYNCDGRVKCPPSCLSVMNDLPYVIGTAYNLHLPTNSFHSPSRTLPTVRLVDRVH